MRVAFSGGGTGGHIYPALAIREALQAEFGETMTSAYIGVSGGMEEKIVSRINNLPFMGVRAQGMPRNLSLKWFSFPIQNLLGLSDAISHLRKFKPDVLVTTGGFVAFPALAGARLLGIPAVIHEQNAAMGVTNRFFCHSARLVMLTYASAGAADNKRIFVTGNPVRSSFLEKQQVSGRFDKKDDEFCILSVGGSRGALSINKAIIEIAKNWLPAHKKVKLLHISGERDYEMIKEELPDPVKNYILLPYLHEMKEAFDVADLVISRAGATILSELAVCAKPAILVPFPHATDNHQEKNARVLEQMGAAKVLIDRELSGQTLAELLEQFFDRNRLRTMAESMTKSRPENVEKNIARLIIDSCKQE